MRGLTARDVMNADLVTVPDSLSVAELADHLIDHEISGAPVEDEEGNLIGVVSLTDIVRAASEGGQGVLSADQQHFYTHGWEDEVDLEELQGLHVENEGLSVRDIMTPSVMAVEAGASLAHVADTMLQGHVHRLLVIDGDRVAGIISTSDLLRVVAEA